MSLMQINLDLDSPHVKSYKTRENLLAAIEKLPDYGREYNDRSLWFARPRGGGPRLSSSTNRWVAM